ncbi:hypothetical protein M3G10_11780 [Dietzia cinnamea]|nr:hypothetical protein [Dietzia cinnamea]
MVSTVNRHEDVRDARELLGLRTPAATVLVAAYVVTFAIVAWSTHPDGGVLAETTAWLVVSIAAIAIIRAPGDPIPMPWTVYLTMVGPLAVALVLAVVPVPIDSLLQLWPLAASTAIYTYMCVRGRTLWAWAGMMAMIGVCMAWAQMTGQGAAQGVSISAINFAPVAMSTFFAWTIRPAARDIYALRGQTLERAAAEAADLAVLDERDRQLARLDTLARPLLERLTDSEPLGSGDHWACSLLEAHLRDSIRAPALAAPQIADAARSARLRGVEVVLLDDHGLDAATDEAVRQRILDAVTDTLVEVETGTLTIRLLPPNRPVLATIVHSAPEGIRRIEYDHDGHPTGEY